MTDVFEKEGESLFGREITTQDYPLSRALYGILKLASENIGHMLTQREALSVINIRIGTVTAYEQNTLENNKRSLKTILTHAFAY